MELEKNTILPSYSRERLKFGSFCVQISILCFLTWRLMNIPLNIRTPKPCATVNFCLEEQYNTYVIVYTHILVFCLERLIRVQNEPRYKSTADET